MKVAKNYMYNVVYQVFVLIVPLITVPYVSRVLGVTGVGINAYTNSIIQYFILFGSIGIALYGNRTIAYYRDNKKEMSKIFWEISILRAITILLAYLGFCIFLYFSDTFKTYFLYQSIFIIAAAFDISWFFMGIEDFKKTVLRNIIIKVISIALIFMCIKTKNDLGLYILILSISQLLGNLSLWPHLKNNLISIKGEHLDIKKHVSLSITLFIPQIAIQIYLVLNKTMLGKMTSYDAAGIFENSDKIIKMILAVVTASGTVLLPRVANMHKKGKRKEVIDLLYKSFDFSSFISIPMMFGIIAIASKFSVWFFGPEFGEAGVVMQLLSSIIIFIAWSNVIGNQYLLPTDKLKLYTTSVTIGAVVNLIGNIILIPKKGVQGAAISTVLAELVVTIIQLYFIRNDFKLKKLLVPIFKYMFSGAIMSICIYQMNNLMEFNIITCLIQILSGILIYIVLNILLKSSMVIFIGNIIRNKKIKSNL